MDVKNIPLSGNYRKYYKSLEPVLHKKKTRVYSTVIFFFLVISLFGWYAIRPTIQTIIELQKEITDKTELNKKMDDKINALIEAQSALEAVKPRLPLLAEAIPENPDAVDVVTKLKALTESTSATLSGLQVSAVPLLTKESTVSAVARLSNQKSFSFPISMSVSGDYQSLRTILDGILNFRRIVSIDTMTFSPKNDRQSTASTSQNIQLILGLTSYYESN